MQPWFQSTFFNKVDKKGRVSVPATFRTALSGRGLSTVSLFPSLSGEPYFEGADDSYLSRLTDEVLANHSPYSEEYEAFALRILGGRVEAAWDAEGRIVLPALLVEEADISDMAVFVGSGQSFQVWNLDSYERRRDQAKDIVRSMRLGLRLRPAAARAESEL